MTGAEYNMIAKAYDRLYMAAGIKYDPTWGEVSYADDEYANAMLVHAKIYVEAADGPLSDACERVAKALFVITYADLPTGTPTLPAHETRGF